MMAGSFGRIGALMLRHWYLLRSSWPRLLDMIYWPTVQMLTWGFITLSMAPASGAAGVGAVAPDQPQARAIMGQSGVRISTPRGGTFSLFISDLISP